MPLTTYFVRHGESQANVDRIFANRLDHPAPLTANGVAQAEDLARSMTDARVSHVYTSPLVRAVQTARRIAETLDVPCLVDNALREYDVGDFEGESYAGEAAWRWLRYEEVERLWREGNHSANHSGGESLFDLEARFMPFMATLGARHDLTAALVLVGHGGLCRAVLPLLMPTISPDYASAHHLGHGDFVIAEYNDVHWRCVQWANESF